MGNIAILDELTINQIAAGEVIDRPMNVVKELVENSIDAEATKIIVEVKNGGKKLIKIVDNGKGIPGEDLDIAIERHSTSKIRNINDLEKIYTMGFRGEALASIAAISRLTITSKTDDEDIATSMVSQGGTIISKDEVGGSRGTTISVENLFYNTPVRYKFLKQDSTESRYIREWVEKAALANTNVSFKLIIDGKTQFQSSGNGSLQDIIYTLYGKEIAENLIEVDFEEEKIKVTGYIGNTRIAKDSRKNQILFLNGRNIQNATLTASSDQAFKGSTGIGKYGFYILNLEMPATYYDINVHPTKMEVRFKEEDIIFKVFYHAIKNAILSEQFLGNTENEMDHTEYIENELEFVTNKLEKQEEDYNLIERKEKRHIDYKYIGIIFKTYIVVEIDGEIYLIDQHAAHERILYEQIKENYKNNLTNNTQMTLIPEVVNLTHKEMEFVENNMDIFNNLGFEMESFGENSLKIFGIPDLEYKTKTNTIFMDTLDEVMTEERTSIKDIEERFIATVACKAAVKAHMDLTKEEVDFLIQNLLNLNHPYTCPHGRPTTIKISKDQLKREIS